MVKRFRMKRERREATLGIPFFRHSCGMQDTDHKLRTSSCLLDLRAGVLVGHGRLSRKSVSESHFKELFTVSVSQNLHIHKLVHIAKSVDLEMREQSLLHAVL